MSIKKDVPDVGLSLSGNLDMVTSEVLNETFERLDEVQMRSLTISIGGLNFIDSTGVGQLLGYYKRCTARDIGFRIENDNPEIEAILEIIGIREIVNS
ncbi:MAG: STAS domain-containing protein [Firmicutes bacterium]|nr:STAS domain-containing protein [Bacillota bacterium]